MMHEVLLCIMCIVCIMAALTVLAIIFEAVFSLPFVADGDENVEDVVEADVRTSNTSSAEPTFADMGMGSCGLERSESDSSKSKCEGNNNGDSDDETTGGYNGGGAGSIIGSGAAGAGDAIGIEENHVDIDKTVYDDDGMPSESLDSEEKSESESPLSCFDSDEYSSSQSSGSPESPEASVDSESMSMSDSESGSLGRPVPGAVTREEPEDDTRTAGGFPDDPAQPELFEQPEDEFAFLYDALEAQREAQTAKRDAQRQAQHEAQVRRDAALKAARPSEIEAELLELSHLSPGLLTKYVDMHEHNLDLQEQLDGTAASAANADLQARVAAMKMELSEKDGEMSDMESHSQRQYALIARLVRRNIEVAPPETSAPESGSVAPAPAASAANADLQARVAAMKKELSEQDGEMSDMESHSQRQYALPNDDAEVPTEQHVEAVEPAQMDPDVEVHRVVEAQGEKPQRELSRVSQLQMKKLDTKARLASRAEKATLKHKLRLRRAKKVRDDVAKRDCIAR